MVKQGGASDCSKRDPMSGERILASNLNQGINGSGARAALHDKFGVAKAERRKMVMVAIQVDKGIAQRSSEWHCG